MIKVTIVKDKFDYKVIKSEGHANYGQHGQDIVCSAISTLIQTAIQGIINLSKHDSYHMKPGDLSVTVSANASKDQQERANTILATIALGVETISNMYQENVSIYYEESGNHEES